MRVKHIVFEFWKKWYYRRLWLNDIPVHVPLCLTTSFIITRVFSRPCAVNEFRAAKSRLRMCSILPCMPCKKCCTRHSQSWEILLFDFSSGNSSRCTKYFYSVDPPKGPTSRAKGFRNKVKKKQFPIKKRNIFGCQSRTYVHRETRNVSTKFLQDVHDVSFGATNVESQNVCWSIRWCHP